MTVVKVDPVVGREAFAKVARMGMNAADLADVRAAALWVWYGRDLPGRAVLRGPHASEAVSLLERLSYYNVVPLQRKKQLKRLVSALRSEEHRADNADRFEQMFSKFLPELQPMQSRAFETVIRA